MHDTKLMLPGFLQAEIDAAELVITRVSYNSASFKDVLSVASRAYRKPMESVSYPADEYSEIYAARCNDKMVGTISATRASLGSIVFEEHYPIAVLQRFRPILCSAYRLCVIQSLANATKVSRILMMACWADEM